MSSHVLEDRVFEICQSAMLRTGKKLQTNKYTKPQDTYLWRTIKTLAKNFTDWNFTDQEIQRFINLALDKSKSDARFSISKLHSKELIVQCYSEMQQCADVDENLVEEFKLSHKWVTEHCYPNVVENLIAKQSHDSLPNFIMWYKSQKIRDIYMCLSIDCQDAVDALTPHYDRTWLPSKSKLYILSNKLSQPLLAKIKETLI